MATTALMREHLSVRSVRSVRPERPTGGHARAHAAALLGLTVAVGAAVLVGLGRPSFAQDEAFTAVLVRTPSRVFWHIVTEREANSSAFYVIARWWSRLGRTEGWERLPSAAATVATVPVLWLVGRRVADRATALLAAALLAGAGSFVTVAHYGRGYGPELLLTTAASLALLVAVQDGRRTAWWAWAVLIALASYTHVFALLVLAAHVGALSLARPRPMLRAWLGPFALVAGLLAPLLLFFATRSGDQVFWVPPTTLDAAGHMLRTVLGGGTLLVGLRALAFVAGVWFLLRRRGLGDGWAASFVLMWATVPLAAGVAVSMVKPLLVPMYFMVALPPLALVMAVGVRRLPRPVGPALLVVLVLLGARSTVLARSVPPVEDWRSAVSYLVGHARASDGLAVGLPDERAPIEHYALRATTASSLPRPCYPGDPWGRLAPRSGRRAPGTTAEVLACAAGRPRLWLVRRTFASSVQAPMRLTGWRRASTVRFRGVEVVELIAAGT